MDNLNSGDVLAEVRKALATFGSAYQKDEVGAGLENEVDLWLHHLPEGIQLEYTINKSISLYIQTGIRQVIFRITSDYQNYIISVKEI